MYTVKCSRNVSSKIAENCSPENFKIVVKKVAGYKSRNVKKVVG